MKAKNVTLIVAMTVFVFAVCSKADIVILQSGDIVAGKITRTNSDGVEIETRVGTVHWSASNVKDVRTEEAEQTTNRIPSWVTIISELAKSDWGHDLKQIPATVVDNGVLKDVPYISFRCGSSGYEVNVYGDLDNPACVEIGAVGYRVKSDEAKSNCVDFMSSILAQDGDKQKVRSLAWTVKDAKKRDGMIFEITLPDEPDAYGGWWISVYSDKALDGARASGPELLAITQPKIKPKVVSPVAPPANYWSDGDISAYSRPSPDSSYGGGMVYVHGYTRANGTYVSSYYRRYPSR